jgi:muramoyltetrapeptide carboxypeptidase
VVTNLNLSLLIFHSPAVSSDKMRILKPQRLRPGALVGVVAPASQVNDSVNTERGVRYLESLGYRVMVGEHAGRRIGYLAGTDKQRVADLHTMFRHREVSAIFCLRGGYGTPRLLPFLDYAMIARNPKILAGFSDITALQLALLKKCGLVTFHGPMVAVEMAAGMDQRTEEMFWGMLSSPSRPPAIRFESQPVSVLHRGTAEGRLIGGNLSLLVSLVGTPYLPRLEGGLLCIEDVNEEPYRIDRMLTHLRNAGVLGKVSGIISGNFLDCVPKDPSTPSLTVEEVLRECASATRVPFLANLPFGHSSSKLTLPVGVQARLRAGARVLEFLESPVC